MGTLITMLFDCSYEVSARAARTDVTAGVVAQRASSIHNAVLAATSSSAVTRPDVRTTSPSAKDHRCVETPLGRRA